jgi:hypothetical protein
MVNDNCTCEDIMKNLVSSSAFFLPLSIGIVSVLVPLPPSAFALGLHAHVAVNIGGQDYNITYENFSHVANSGLFAPPPLGRMPWWGSESSAIAFASAVGSKLGLPNNNSGVFEGPTFAYQVGSFGFGTYGLDVQNFVPLATDCCVIVRGQYFSSVSSYAVVADQAPQDIPAPLPIIGVPVAFGLSRQLRRRMRLG